jgi:hypothetical protein
MKIIQFSISKRNILYCPSTDEVILGNETENVNYQAKAFIAGWFSEESPRPLIKDMSIRIAWEEFLRLSFKKEPLTDEMVSKFLTKYNDPELVVYTNSAEASHAGYERAPVWYVVPWDTVIEHDTE